MKLSFLSSKISWFGKHSGYDVLTDYISLDNYVEITQSGNSSFGRIIGKLFQLIYKWNWINTQDIYTELKFNLKINSKNVSHILYIESHLQLIEKIGRNKANVIATIHLPFNQWQKEWLELLRQYNHAIILYEKEFEIFAKYLPANNIHFIRHGININFFKPDITKIIKKNKILIIGHYLRNFDMLFSVYENIINGKNNLEFHVVIPELYRNNEALIKMKLNEDVFFYQKLSDQELLEQYQTSNILLLPMNDSGANSAIVQALAVGLPVITTDVGGIRSYGGGEIYPIIENNNVNDMVSLFERYYNEIGYREMISTNIRNFAEQKLDWNIIAKQHEAVYASILN